MPIFIHLQSLIFGSLQAPAASPQLHSWFTTLCSIIKHEILALLGPSRVCKGQEAITIRSRKINMTTSKQQSKATTSSKRGRSSVEASSSKERATKPRYRASVACVACRDRRVRCVVPPGDKDCTPCKRSGIECVIKNDDERRRYAPRRL
jgi:hypothetical protein